MDLKGGWGKYLEVERKVERELKMGIGNTGIEKIIKIIKTYICIQHYPKYSYLTVNLLFFVNNREEYGGNIACRHPLLFPDPVSYTPVSLLVALYGLPNTNDGINDCYL